MVPTSMGRAKYTKEVLQAAVDASLSLAGVLRFLGFRAYSGGMSNHIRTRIKFFGISIEHFSGKPEPSVRLYGSAKSADEILQAGYSRRASSALLRRALLEIGHVNECRICKQPPEWMGKPLVLHVDHIDGDWSNNCRNNLQLLCPHCHSQTSTYGTKNKRVTRQQRPCLGCEGFFVGKGTASYCSLKCFNSHRVQPTRANWPDKDRLGVWVWEEPVEKIASQLGVSGTALRKRCKRLGLPVPGRGYWQRINSC